jgi:HPt (histidine-containing phosphotransfer) domain-containing protein
MEASATAVLLAAEESLNSGATETLEKALAQSETEFDRAQRIFQSLAPEGEGARAAEGRRLFNQAASLAREVVKLFEVRKPAEGEFAKRRAELVPRVKAELEKMSKPAESALPGPAPAPPPDRRPLLAALVLAAGVCLSGAAGFLAVRGAAAPLKPLREALRAAAQGNLSVRAESTGSDELGDMSRCFNQLMDERRRLEEGLKSRAATPPAEEKPAPPPPPTQVRLPADTKHLVERFLENRRTDANLIAKALVVQDFGAAYGFSHNMKATAESLGFPAVAELAAKMELAAERGDERTASGLLKALNLYLDQVEVIYE